MKWAKTLDQLDYDKLNVKAIVKELAKLHPKDVLDEILKDPDLKEYVELYMDDFALCSELKTNFGVWVKDRKIPYELDRTDKAKYESYVGGFLTYFENYDPESTGEELTAYFDWEESNGSTTLTIYLKPFYNKAYPTKARRGGGGGSSKVAVKSPIPPPPGFVTDPPLPTGPPPPPKPTYLHGGWH